MAISLVALSACGDKGGGEGLGNVISGITSGDKLTAEKDVAADAPERDSTPQVLGESADGAAAYTGSGATIDYSHAADGYIMAKYEGDNPKVKLQITKDGGETYTYDLQPNTDFVGFPLSQDTGGYQVAAFLNVEGDKYSPAASGAVQADITDEFQPFLRPNQYSNFNSGSQAVAKSAEVVNGTKSDLGAIEAVFVFVINNVEYDYDKAATVQSGYVPSVDETLSTGKGICFDYAALTACMLRAQRIPCKLVVGYAGEAYHAWISVHVEGVGWVDNMIQFNGDSWTLMDPTFASSGDTADPNVVGDGENYNPVYYY
ncbi:MAG: transglutaminase domain-containing protein [Clostridiales Family XIII bacterium]|nr:transglutaminase domain-containing protein [Clostridiales Family XIII bacterium]